MKYVIIGNSAAAVGCIESIRRLDTTGSITVISDEKYHTYSRPLISYFLQGKTAEEHMKYRDDNFYLKNNCTFLAGKKVVSLDIQNKQVELDDKSKIPYGKVLVATGSRPFVPPMAGLETLPQYFTFMTLDSAKKIDEAINRQSRVLIIGGGLIGLKCAEGIADRVAKVTVVEMAPRILPAVLNEKGSSIVQRQMEKHNCSFILGDSVKQFIANFPKKDGSQNKDECKAKQDSLSSQTGNAKSPLGGEAVLNNGGTLEFDVLITAVGVRPNTQLVSDAGGQVNRGIVIDEDSRTSIADVFAAGDCTECKDISSDTNRILALLPNAYMQGESAGISMAGGSHPFDKAMPLNAAGFFGLHMATAGSYTGEEKGVVKTDDDGNITEYRRFFVDKDLLKGFIIIGNIERAGIYTSIIRRKIPLTTIDFDLIMEKPQLMGFEVQERKRVLGAAV